MPVSGPRMSPASQLLPSGAGSVTFHGSHGGHSRSQLTSSWFSSPREERSSFPVIPTSGPQLPFPGSDWPDPSHLSTRDSRRGWWSHLAQAKGKLGFSYPRRGTGCWRSGARRPALNMALLAPTPGKTREGLLGQEPSGTWRFLPRYTEKDSKADRQEEVFGVKMGRGGDPRSW